jgi:L-seryl-tRNA(Ser) seleniumtransferase
MRFVPAPDPNPLRALPSVERLLATAAGRRLCARWRRERVVEVLRAEDDAARAAVRAGGEAPDDAALLAGAAARLDAEAAPRLAPVVNATGVVLHTNLGRAPLAADAIAAVTAAARGAVALELDLASGRRGRRDDLVADDLVALTGAEAALVVNNNAAATLLGIAALAAGREVLVSRGELVEIGGSFRMPDVMAASGARLREVGTTNRTHARDYRDAVGPETALIVKVHTSNFRIVGFTASVGLDELVAIGRGAGVRVLHDLGSGALVDLRAWGLPYEPTVAEHVATGVDLVCFSGDKLLGGPQAGIVVGRREAIDVLARHPLRRALRPDKLTLAALAATLRLHRDAPDLRAALPVLRWLARPVDEMDALGAALAPRLAAHCVAAWGPGWHVTVVSSEAEAGSGALPVQPLASRALAVAHDAVPPERVARAFRRATPAVLGRVHQGRFLLDLRGIFEPEMLLVALPPCP